MEKSEVNIGVWMRSYCSVEFYVASMLRASDAHNCIVQLNTYRYCDENGDVFDEPFMPDDNTYTDWLKTNLMGGEL